jgi:hypothetical protein
MTSHPASFTRTAHGHPSVAASTNHIPNRSNDRQLSPVDVWAAWALLVLFFLSLFVL